MRNPSNGFTLVELMVAMLILAILATIAVPSFQDFIVNNRVTATTNNIVTALNLARSESLRSATPVSMCASTDQATCTGGVDWSGGWIVFRDGAGAVGQVDGTDVMLQAWPPVPPGISTQSSVAFARYDAAGMMNLGAAVDFDVWKPGCTGNKLGRTNVSVIGSLQSSKLACP